ncbi:hypothetical protein LINGRAPRIM_LOCUS780 [Linum grandiflorum]
MEGESLKSLKYFRFWVSISRAGLTSSLTDSERLCNITGTLFVWDSFEILTMTNLVA